ncbi:MAG: DUF6502 family protein [Granulosicoccus sp.]
MKQMLAQALYSAMRPLAGILLRQGIAVGEVVSIVKRAFVDAAHDDLVDDGLKPTTARIAIQVGLTRKDVAQLRDSDGDTDDPAQLNRLNRVLFAWKNDQKYRDATQSPAVLAEENGDAASLRTLIAAYSGDMPFNSMKEELLRSGAIEAVGAQRWALVSTEPRSFADEQAVCMAIGEHAAQLLSTIEHNLRSPERQHFQNQLQVNNLSDLHMAEFCEFSATENAALLSRLALWLSDRGYDCIEDCIGQSGKEGDVHAGVGVYYFAKRNAQ